MGRVAVSGATVSSVSRGVVSVDPVKPGLPTLNVPAGKEVEVTARMVSVVLRRRDFCNSR